MEKEDYTIDVTEDYYLNYKIVAKDTKKYKYARWSIYDKMGVHILSDYQAANGDKLQSNSHAINDAKRNIDILIRLKSL